MRSIFPIYKLTLRSILRERVALSMLVLLALVLFLLPSGLETDGTVQGGLRIHIRYSLGLSTFLIAAMTLWASCASIAGDLTSKRLHMLLTKPVSRAAVWWGKWLAVVTLATSLTLISGGLTYLRVKNMIHNAGLSETELSKVYSHQVTARRPVEPLQEDFSEEAEELATSQLESGAVPENFPREQLVREMIRYLKVTHNAASAGESVSYTFELAKPLEDRESLQIAYEYDGAAMGISNVPGAWRVDLPDEEGIFTFETLETPYGQKVISFEVNEQLAGAETLILTFENRSEESSRVFFKPERGVRLFFEAGNFAPNLFRALLLISGLLAILAAIGVSTGAVFSLPVACYVSAVVILMQSFSGMVEKVVEAGVPVAEENQSGFSHGVELVNYRVYQGMLVVLKPMQVESPLGRVSEGVVVSAGEVASVFLFRFSPVVLLLGASGIYLFSRREIGEVI